MDKKLATLLAMYGDFPTAYMLYKTGGGGGSGTGRASGPIATFETTKSANLKALRVAIEPVQAGSGDPSPENVRPISGRAAISVWRTGLNMFVIPEGTKSKAGVSYTYDAGTNTLTKSGTSDGVAGLNLGSITLPAGTYTFSADFSGETGTSTKVYIRDAATDTNIGNFGKSSPSLTLALDGTYYIRVATNNGETGGVISKFQLERSESQTDYVKNQGEAYSVTFPSDPGTVYGGTLDVVSGVLTVDRAMRTMNTSTMDNTEAYPGWRSAGIRDIVGGDVSAVFRPALLNIGTAFGANTTGSYDILYLPGRFYGNKTQTEWKALAIDVQIVLNLATPLTYNLTPTQIKTLVGTNNIWSDAGDVDVTYRR